MNTKKRDQVNELVDRQVFANDTKLINDLIALGDIVSGRDAFSYDNIENAFTEFVPAIEPEIDTCSCCDYEGYLDIETGVCDGCFEPEINEIMEWWRVTSWFAEKLKASGEPILENEYGSWWGRCTSGQAICMDWVIKKIYDEVTR